MSALIVTLHGIGRHALGYSGKWKVREHLGPDVAEVLYDDVFDRAAGIAKTVAKVMAAQFKTPLVSWVGKEAVDRLGDIFLFFLSKAVRDEIEKRIMAVVMTNPGREFWFVGHSLGTLVMRWFLMRHPELSGRSKMLSLACPEGSPLLEKITRYWMARIIGGPFPGVLPVPSKQWENVASQFDPISGVVEDYPREQQHVIPAKAVVRHSEVAQYIEHYVMWKVQRSKKTA